jgi:hypothetical protein
MFINRKNESVYIGHDLKEFNCIRNLLDNANVKYNHKVRNHQSQFLIPGQGTIRGRFGSLGTDLDNSYEYEITVSSIDKAKVIYIIQQQKEKK